MFLILLGYSIQSILILSNVILRKFKDLYLYNIKKHFAKPTRIRGLESQYYNVDILAPPCSNFRNMEQITFQSMFLIVSYAVYSPFKDLYLNSITNFLQTD